MILKLLLLVLTVSQALAVAPDCVPAKCKLPDCLCSGVKPPGGTVPSQNPQIVYMTMSGDSITQAVYDLVIQLDPYFKNPNNCPFNATLFGGGRGADYFDIEELFYQRTFEVGQRTMDPVPQTTRADWTQQIESEREALKLFSNLPPENVNTFQAPRLVINEALYEALYDVGVKYDHSRPTCKYAHAPSILFPYTYDYLSTQECPFGECPVNSYPGLWEVPMIDSLGKTGSCCGNFIEGCTEYVNATSDQLFTFLRTNFEKVRGNRAPYGLYLTPAWLTDEDYGPVRKEALGRLFDYFMENKVWVISISQLVDWMKNPVTSEEALEFEPWKCPSRLQPRCSIPNKCVYTQGSVSLTMTTCSRCPNCYPTAKDPTGQVTPCPPMQ